MRARVAALALLAAIVSPSASPAGAEEAAVAVGQEVGPLRFTDTRYLRRSLEDLGEARAYVLAFTTTGCPLAQRYLGRLARLERDLRERGVRFLSVNVGPADTLGEVAAQLIEHDAAFPGVKDYDRSVVRACGVARTPEVVVLDAERRLRYRGRVDDQYRLGGVRPEPTREDLREAIADVLAGREVRVPETPVDGCLISPPPAPAVEGDVTFARDVAPILQRHCQECHRPGTEAPFALLSYEDAYTVSDMIAEVVVQRRMPPWFATDAHDAFANRRGLTPAERDTLLAWVDQGAPEGDSADLPPPRSFEEGRWKIGEPDLVIQSLETFEIPAEGYVDYKYAILPYTFQEETWVEAIQILPDNPRVLHHCNLAYVLPEKGLSNAHFLTGKVPGSGPMRLAPGIAQRIPKGANLLLQIHYTTTGKPETDRLSVGLRFPRQPVRKQLHHLIVNDQDFEIPPFAPAHEVRARRRLKTDADVVGYFAHMHLRGRDMTFVVHPPQGEPETVLRIPNYSFDWQLGYDYGGEGRRFPRGTVVECIGHFDNSVWNPYNPDPTAAVGHGEQTYNEMFFGFVFYTDPDQELDLRIDPATGAARPAEEAEAPPRRYY